MPALFATMLTVTMRHQTAESDAPLELAVSHAERAPNLIGRLIEYDVNVVRTSLDDDATAGERERGSLEPLLTVPVRREQLIYGKILGACAFMLISRSLTLPGQRGRIVAASKSLQQARECLCQTQSAQRAN